MKKRVLAALCCLCILTGCSVKMDMPNNTNSIEMETESSTEETTTTPTAEAVAELNALSANKIVWGPGSIVNHTPPTEPQGLNEKYKALDALWLTGEKKEVLLTFDEGYENGFTPQILDALKEKQVKAVFFVTYDFARDNPALIDRMIKEGHTVGNHSYHHYSMDELDAATAEEEVMFLHRYMQEKHHYTMRYFRFPKGEFSEQNLALLQKLGYKSVFWSFAYADWDVNAQPDAAFAMKKICESAHPGEIMLLHAVSKTNADLLGSVIDDIRQQGYTFKDEF